MRTYTSRQYGDERKGGQVVQSSRSAVESHLSTTALVLDQNGESTQEGSRSGAESSVPDLGTNGGEEEEGDASSEQTYSEG